MVMDWRRYAPYIQAVLGEQPTAADVDEVEALLVGLGEQPSVLDGEARFVDLAAKLRAHPRLGAPARRALAQLPLAKAIAAIERYPRRGPRVTRGPMPETRDFLARYRAGDRAVWDELIGHASAISLHAELREEAREVAKELAARIPGARASSFEAPVELVGPIPLSVEACWSVGIAVPPREVLDAYAARVAASHREIVGPLELPVLDRVVELPPSSPVDAVDPVVRGEGVRLIEFLRARLGATF